MPAPLDPSLLVDGPDRARATLAFAHGAGAPMDSPFMETVAAGLAAAGLRVVRFEFPYMDARRRTGKRSPPDRAPVLEARWREVIAALRRRWPRSPLFVGGKSMGGRFASRVADEARVRGLFALGYPFHPPGRPDRLRTEHLRTLRTPALFLQGERDALGSRAEVEGYELARSITVHWLVDGDHSLKPRRASGRTEAENLEAAVEALVRFVERRRRARKP